MNEATKANGTEINSIYDGLATIYNLRGRTYGSSNCTIASLASNGSSIFVQCPTNCCRLNAKHELDACCPEMHGILVFLILFIVIVTFTVTFGICFARLLFCENSRLCCHCHYNTCPSFPTRPRCTCNCNCSKFKDQLQRFFCCRKHVILEFHPLDN